MERDRWLSLTVGGLVLASLSALAISILSLSAQQGVWKARYRLVARFDDVGGLIGGAPVWLAGTRVGRVESVRFASAGTERPAVEVVLHIDEAVKGQIRSDSVARIGTIGLLGDRYVDLEIGTAAGRVLEAGDEVPTLSPVDLNLVIQAGTHALDNIRKLTENLNTAMAAFERERGARRLADSIAAVEDIVTQLREGRGLLHSLIYGQYQGRGVESIERSLVLLEDLLGEIRDGDGLLHSLVYGAPQDQELVRQLSSATARLDDILGRIDRGEGTLGLLLSDPTLYEELKQLVGGAGRSGVVRGMIRLLSAGGQ